MPAIHTIHHPMALVHYIYVNIASEDNPGSDWQRKETVLQNINKISTGLMLGAVFWEWEL